ncbi:hypothetical protein Cflav_PD4713 [Pedosphaera parvula Ellin514]|uniref:Uncharacterized protein n=1 Tax=Pedosphaera parvula (strain Ellin514) TaxID=320771 RepID=B9XEF9_PEDPL|nr:hypothetical protein Cflav_PD4713 [Pedosphaera parvula Ellin514]
MGTEDYNNTMPDKPYTREELMALATDSLPKRGILCPKCKQLIPQFAELDDKNSDRILVLIRQRSPIQAIVELRSATGAPLSWAKLWVHHSGRPDAVGTTAPCPYCGKPLITALAKQCRYCLMDWHNAEKPKKLSSPG